MSEAIKETHPLKPFLPKGTRILMLGSFPPARKRWSMEFFYPNFSNDMWRIFGIILHGDKTYFVDQERKTFRQEHIEKTLTTLGIGIYDTATEVVRTLNTAADKDLEVVTPTDIASLLRQIPQCKNIVTTGKKAAEVLAEMFNVTLPKVGGCSDFMFEERQMRLYRMPSSSRAYPLKVEKKAEFYEKMLRETGILKDTFPQ